MAEALKILGNTKNERYEGLYGQIEAVLEDECDAIANMANISAMISGTFGFWWTGFYRVIGEELVLGPFQGPMACTRIPYGKGVCGTAWKLGKTVVVPDVDAFPGHIACSSVSRSEIVVPVFDRNGCVTGVLDIDSSELATFDETDRFWLEKIVSLLK
jgi:GAF domain-containing protein